MAGSESNGRGERVPVVEIGAIVTVRNETDGSVHTWRLVAAKSAANAPGELTAGTPAGQALLGRAIGDTVDVLSNTPVRLTLIELEPALPKPAPTHREPPDVPVSHFSRGQDAEYEAWVRQNGGGYVLIYGSSRGYMLHHVSCFHIGLDSTATLATTAPTRPRVCSRSKAVLEHRSRAETGELPVRCGTCFG